jgi:hypothetical protein
MLNPDFRDILYAFVEEHVEFIVVGAYALAVHGLPRATGDFDLWVRPSSDNSNKIWKALKRFGAPMKGLSEKDFEDKDLITSISEVDFDSAWESRQQVEVEGIEIPVLGKDELIRNLCQHPSPPRLIPLRPARGAGPADDRN